MGDLIEAVLVHCEEYFDEKADLNNHGTANEEAVLLAEVRGAIEHYRRVRNGD